MKPTPTPANASSPTATPTDPCQNKADDPVTMSIPADDLKAVLPFKACQDVRYYLNGVLVEKVETGGCMLVATNGHVLVAMHSAAASIDETRILAVSDGLSDALRKADGIQRTVEVVGAKGRATLHAQGLEAFIQPREAFIDGRFPDWRKVVPAVEKLEAGLAASVSAEYLATLKRALPPSQRRSPLSFWHQKTDPKNSGIVVRFEANPSLVAVVMPMQLTHEWTWPSWMKREPPEPVQEAAA